MMDQSHQLSGLRILVTRPQPQADKLTHFLRKQGAEVSVLPMLEIIPKPAGKLPHPVNIAEYDKVVVVSTSAAELLFRQSPVATETAQWFTPGRSTVRVLADFAVEAICPEAVFTSEAMLAMPELQSVADQHILLVKGEGGRDILEQALSERGAKVRPLVLYQRVCPEYPNGQLDQTLEEQKINAIVATSGQIVANLLTCASDRRLLLDIPILVPSQRVAEMASEVGFTRTVIATGAGDADIAVALRQLAYQG